MHCLHGKMGMGNKNERIGELNSSWLKYGFMMRGLKCLLCRISTIFIPF